MPQVQSLRYSKFLEISVSLFYVVILYYNTSILGFVYFVLILSFRKGFYVFKRLFVMDPMKSRFEFFQLSQRQKTTVKWQILIIEAIELIRFPDFLMQYFNFL